MDSLAPERAAYRVGTKANEVERYRTPRGCVLQAAAGAVDRARGSLTPLRAPSSVSCRSWRGAVLSRTRARRDAGLARSWSRSWYCDRSRVGWAGPLGALRTERAPSTDALAVHCAALLERWTSGLRRSGDA